MRREDERPWRVVAALDTETTNVDDGFGNVSAFTALYQIGHLRVPVEDVTPGNVRDVCTIGLFRDDDSAWREVLSIASEHAHECVPVVCVHNLGFDMHAVASKLLGFQERGSVRVLAKTPQKPISIALKSDDRTVLVIWDTLLFSGMGLAKMGEACAFEKGVGEWDYELIRAPQTALTDDEEDYAKRDIWALFCWLAWYLKTNPIIQPDDLGRFACTKTGAVRVKRRRLLEELKGVGSKKTVGEHWHANNEREKLDDDDMLFTVQACTRGGFTFCASAHAGAVFTNVHAFDAKSQHPAQMVSRMYPVGFTSAPREVLEADARAVLAVTPERIMDKWACPFPVAFCARFDFLNLRPKRGSLYERHGIHPLAYARIKHAKHREGRDDEADAQREAQGYADQAPDGCEHAFGKVISASVVTLYLTELGFWEVGQAYEWDAMHAVDGYETARFVRPSDMSVLSVLEFYKRKDAIKHIRQLWHSGAVDDAAGACEGVLPDYIAADMHEGIDVSDDLESYYMGSKADLNGLFGIEATNEAKRDMVLDERGIEYTGCEGAANLPKAAKAWYQFGQRIVGWSRIAQHLVMQGLEPHCTAIINGDTDSMKVAGLDRKAARAFLDRFGHAVDTGKHETMARVRRAFPDRFDELEGIGHYELEAVYPEFYSAWNKSYCVRDEAGRYHITLAGVPSGKRSPGEHDSLEDFAEALHDRIGDFQAVCGCILGYNTTISADITKLRQRSIPRFASRWRGTVRDWRGDTYEIDAPAAVGLAPLAKTIGGTGNPDNLRNALYTGENNPHLMTESHLLYWGKDGMACVQQDMRGRGLES